MGIENPVHILFIAIVALIVLGPKRLPELTRAAGKSIREFREALNGGVVESDGVTREEVTEERHLPGTLPPEALPPGPLPPEALSSGSPPQERASEQDAPPTLPR